MLGKLLKYEIKATARLFIPLYLTILVFATINRLFFPMNNVSQYASTLYNFAMSVSMFIYATLMIGMVVLTLLVMIQRFYKNLLGDEGYLMFTLPVQSHKHIFSKLTTSMLWTIISGIVGIWSILIISSHPIFIQESFKEFLRVFDLFRQYFGRFAFLVSFEAIVLALLSLASTILSIYAAIALGHLFNKHRLLISFVMYIVLKTAGQILMVIFAFIFSRLALPGIENNYIPSVSAVNTILLIAILYSGIMTAGYFILTNYLLKRRLNLE